MAKGHKMPLGKHLMAGKTFFSFFFPFTVLGVTPAFAIIIDLDLSLAFGFEN